MNEINVAAQFEEDVRSAMLLPAMPDAAMARLQKQLAAKADEMTAAQARPFYRRPAWTLAMAVLLIFVITILVLGPQRVLAAMLDWLRYVPGYGFVQEGELRVQEEPVVLERDGITVSVDEGLMDAQTLWLTIHISGLQPEHWPEMENDAGCGEMPVLRMPDGSILRSGTGVGGSGFSWKQLQLTYPALLPDQNEVTLVLPCLSGLRADTTPANWELPLQFVPAPADYPAIPVTLIPSPISVEPVESGESANQGNSADGIELVVSSMAELEDGYLFQGYLSWQESPYEYVQFNQFEMSVTDAEGNVVSNAPVNDAYSLQTPPDTWPWTVRTRDKNITGPVTFNLPSLQIHESLAQSETTYFEIDLGDEPQIGQVWQIDQTLAWEDYQVKVLEASFDSQRGIYFLNFKMQVDNSQIGDLSLTDPNNQSEMRAGKGGGGGGGGGSESTVIEIVQAIGYDYVPQGVRHIQVENYKRVLSGPWTASVELPETQGEQAALPEEPVACITEEGWQELMASPPQALPDDIQGRFLMEDFSGAPALLPTLYVTSLQGGDSKTIGQGSWGAFLPDGEQVVYAFEGLRVFDLASGESTFLAGLQDAGYAMRWSPDGTRIAFIRGAQGLHMINADGSGLQQVAGSSNDMIGIAGWLPDGQRIVVARIAPEGTQIQTVELGSGKVQDNFLIDQRKGGFAILSPDGTRVVFHDNDFASSYAVYVAALDGSGKQLITHGSDLLGFSTKAWSPDGNWLVMSVREFGIEPAVYHNVLVNVESCQAIYLENISGQIVDWAP